MTRAGNDAAVAGEPAGAARGRSAILHVCTSCRPADAPRLPREGRAGAALYRELRARLDDDPLGDRVEVRPAECLSICPRPCGIAISSASSWSYLFGDQVPGESVEEILACVSVFLDADDGFMPRKQRPEGLRASILGRVPPFEGPR